MDINVKSGPEYSQAEILEDIINGIRSGIPECCVQYYIEIKASLPRKRCGVAKHVHENIRGFVWGETGLDSVRYVRCPTCHSEDKIVDTIRNGVLDLHVLPDNIRLCNR